MIWLLQRSARLPEIVRPLCMPSTSFLGQELDTTFQRVTLKRLDFETRIYFHNFVEVCYKYATVLSRWHSYIIKVRYRHHPFLLSSVKVFLMIPMSQQNSHQFSFKTTWQRNVSVCNTHMQICDVPWKWSWSVLQTMLPSVLQPDACCLMNHKG